MSIERCGNGFGQMMMKNLFGVVTRSFNPKWRALEMVLCLSLSLSEMVNSVFLWSICIHQSVGIRIGKQEARLAGHAKAQERLQNESTWSSSPSSASLCQSGGRAAISCFKGQSAGRQLWRACSPAFSPRGGRDPIGGRRWDKMHMDGGCHPSSR